MLKQTQPKYFQIPRKAVTDWDQLGRLSDDACAIQIQEMESQGSGQYQLSGYDPSYQGVDDYSNRMKNRLHFQKVYRDSNDYIDRETNLFFAESTNPRVKNQLFTRPYAGSYCGAGMHCLGHKDVETSLLQGQLTNLRQKPCETCRGRSMYRFYCLPEYGNPQRTEHIIQDNVVRGGMPSRDLVRRLDYRRRCSNQVNNQQIHKQ